MGATSQPSHACTRERQRPLRVGRTDQDRDATKKYLVGYAAVWLGCHRQSLQSQVASAWGGLTFGLLASLLPFRSFELAAQAGPGALRLRSPLVTQIPSQMPASHGKEDASC